MPLRHDNPDLVFVHLSDIHFREGHTGDLHDKDQALRHELELDLRRLRTRVPRLDGLLITGDIAYGGKKKEYEYATGWIERIRELVGCDRRGVMVTPGNHDVDRSLVPLEGEIDGLHQAIRRCQSIDEYDEALAQMLRDEVQGDSLMRPLAVYNAFAEPFGCQVSRMAPYWERSFPLSDGTIFLIRGITSVFISGERDHEQTHKMFYGGAQRTILRIENTRRALIGHHPPSWALEGDDAERIFSGLTVLQAFGHKHNQWITQVGNSVRIIAGALHPDRREPQWIPRYSAFGISTLDEQTLGMRIYPQRWSDEEQMFIPDYNSRGQEFRDYTIRVVPRVSN